MHRHRVRPLRWAALAGFLALLTAGPGAAEPIGVGARIGAFQLPDQHGELRAVDASVRIVLFSRDMDGGRVIREALGPDGASLLEQRGAVAVADVSRMPGFVRRFIAGPRLRERPYPLLLDEEGGPTALLPSREGQATLLRLDALRVTSVFFATTPEELLRELTGTPES